MKKVITIFIALELIGIFYPHYIIPHCIFPNCIFTHYIFPHCSIPNCFPNCTSYAASNKTENDNTNEIINNQKENLNISDFVKESEKYTKESMPGVNLNDLLSTAISGNIDNSKLIRLFWSLLRKRSTKFGGCVKRNYSYSCNSWNFKKHHRWPRK